MIRQFDRDWYLTPWVTVEDNSTFNITEFLNKLIVGGNCTINLPEIPIIGTKISLAIGADWEVNNTTIFSHGSCIMGVVRDITLDINKPISLLYKDLDSGFIFSKF